MTEYDIRVNFRNKGFYCNFEFGGKKYYADIAKTPDRGNEVMIFEYDENGEVDYEEKYVDFPLKVNKENLIAAIEDFKKGGQGNPINYDFIEIIRMMNSSLNILPVEKGGDKLWSKSLKNQEKP